MVLSGIDFGQNNVYCILIFVHHYGSIFYQVIDINVIIK